MAVFWNWIWEPMLFVTIGWSINFSTLDRGIIPKSLVIICTGKCRLGLHRLGGHCYNRSPLVVALAICGGQAAS